MVVAKQDLPAGTIFLIDHAWSFLSAEDALAALGNVPQLLDRVCGIIGVNTDMDDIEPEAQSAARAAMAPAAVLRALVPLLGSYTVEASGGAVEDVLVMMDEVGCRIQEATDSPNCVVESLVDVQTGVAFCVACLTMPLTEGEQLLRAPSPFFETKATDRLLSSLGALHAGTSDSVAESCVSVDESTGTGEPEAEVDMSLPVLRIGVMESLSQKKHCSLIYKPHAKTARRISALGATHGYRAEYIQLTSRDFPPNVVDSHEDIAAAARAIASRCDIVLGFCLGELMNWSKDGTYVVDEVLTPRCQRVDDVLAVYGALEEEANGGVVTIPPVAFQRFCFGKARYMRQLVACDVPIAPSLFIDREEVIQEAQKLAKSTTDLQSRESSSELVQRWLLAPKTSALLAACAVVATKVAEEVRALRAESWQRLQPRGESQGTANGLQLVDGRFFVKGDSGWCRNGNSEIKTGPASSEQAEHTAECAVEQAQQQRLVRTAALTGAAGSSSSSDALDCSMPPWSRAEQELFTAQLQSILYRQLAVDRARAVHLQPCIAALVGQAQEFRGFVINGELVAVASTYFRRPGAVSYNLTDVQSEVLLIDHGLPEDDALLGGVPFSRMRAVMEAAAAAIVKLVEHVPIAIRTDCAVDPVNGLVVLSEIEGGLDFSIFPQQVRSFKSVQSQELSITDRICELMAKGVDEAAPAILGRKVK